MKPIHHSKLKKGDLVYVESEIGLHGLCEVFDSHLGGVMTMLGTFILVWDINEHFFLIERGYFL